MQHTYRIDLTHCARIIVQEGLWLKYLKSWYLLYDAEDHVLNASGAWRKDSYGISKCVMSQYYPSQRWELALSVIYYYSVFCQPLVVLSPVSCSPKGSGFAIHLAMQWTKKGTHWLRIIYLCSRRHKDDIPVCTLSSPWPKSLRSDLSCPFCNCMWATAC